MEANQSVLWSRSTCVGPRCSFALLTGCRPCRHPPNGSEPEVPLSRSGARRSPHQPARAPPKGATPAHSATRAPPFATTSPLFGASVSSNVWDTAPADVCAVVKSAVHAPQRGACGVNCATVGTFSARASLETGRARRLKCRGCLREAWRLLTRIPPMATQAPTASSSAPSAAYGEGSIRVPGSGRCPPAPPGSGRCRTALRPARGAR